jgi:hypothetical protein
VQVTWGGIERVCGGFWVSGYGVGGFPVGLGVLGIH